MRLSVVIPMYNEEKIIKRSLTELSAALSGKFHCPDDYEILAVSDGSTDRTVEIVEELVGVLPSLRLISYRPNRGKGGAVKEGIKHAKGNFVLFTDSDLAYGCAPIFTFLEEFENGGGTVILGSRALHSEGYEGYTALRKFMSKTYLLIIRKAAGFSFTDSQCGIKGFSGTIAKELFKNLSTLGFAFDLEILLAAKDRGAKICELPVKIVNHSASTVHPVKDALKMLDDLHKIKKRRKKQQKEGANP